MALKLNRVPFLDFALRWLHPNTYSCGGVWKNRERNSRSHHKRELKVAEGSCMFVSCSASRARQPGNRWGIVAELATMWREGWTVWTPECTVPSCWNFAERWKEATPSLPGHTQGQGQQQSFEWQDVYFVLFCPNKSVASDLSVPPTSFSVDREVVLAVIVFHNDWRNMFI